jgi:HKD family nuclease
MKLLLYEQELLDEVRRQVRRAREFSIAQALITVNGLVQVEKEIRDSLGRGGGGRVLVGIDMPTEPEAIERLLRIQEMYGPQLELRFFKSGVHRMLHAKFAVFRDQHGKGTGIIGSSNLTLGGLTQNYEANALISDQNLVGRLVAYFEEHFFGGHSKPITHEWLQAYRVLWSERQKAVKRLRTIRAKVRRLGARSDTEKAPRRVKGHVFAFTGKIHKWPRATKLYPLIKRLGGQVVPSADGIARADCLVHGDILGRKKSTRKLARARVEKMPIITEEDFFRLVSQERKFRS